MAYKDVTPATSARIGVVGIEICLAPTERLFVLRKLISSPLLESVLFTSLSPVDPGTYASLQQRVVY